MADESLDPEFDEAAELATKIADVVFEELAKGASRGVVLQALVIVLSGHLSGSDASLREVARRELSSMMDEWTTSG